MEDLSKIELEAKINLELGLKEKEMGEKLNTIGISEFKRAKVRKELAHKDFSLNRKRKEFSNDLQDLVEQKLELFKKNDLEFPKEEIEIERNIFKYFNILSEVQIQIAETQLEIAEKEFKISKERLKTAYETIYTAKERIELSKKQSNYIKSIKAKKPKKKIQKLNDNITIMSETILRDREDILKDLALIQQHEIELLELKKKLSSKLEQRERMRPVLSDK
ncbi:MAG: hypothetical protein JW891_15175 [Candidatus Lokiarchaeota archaeon]|nr:hypothetical protein [Candidatus Lokiarchaeota archaeon]